MCPACAGHTQCCLSIRMKETNSVVKILRLPPSSQEPQLLNYEVRLLTCFPSNPRNPALLAAEPGRSIPFTGSSYSCCLLHAPVVGCDIGPWNTLGISHMRLHAVSVESLIFRGPGESLIPSSIQWLLKCCQHNGFVLVVLPLLIFLFSIAGSTGAFLIRRGPEVV